MKHEDFPVVIPVDSEGNIYFVKMHRYTTDFESIELPMGHADGETPLVAGRRELREETGLVSVAWEKLGEFHVANGIAAIKGVVFLAYNVEKVGNPIEMEDESIDSVLKYQLLDVKKLIAEGVIKDDITITAIAKADYLGLL